MNTAELTIAVLAGTLLAILLLVVFLISLTGKDLVIFDRYRTADPKAYKNLRSVCRFNCPLVALMCICGLAATPFIAFDPEGGVLFAIANLAGSAIFLWLSIRWFLWSLHG